MYELPPQTEGNVLGVRVSGTVTGDDYERFRPVIDERVRQHGKVRLLIWMDAFDGWGDLDAAWEDLKLDAAHPVDVERLALVGDGEWHAVTAWLDRLFVPDEVRSFSEALLGEAWDWVREGADVPRP